MTLDEVEESLYLFKMTRKSVAPKRPRSIAEMAQSFIDYIESPSCDGVGIELPGNTYGSD